jgi:PAS domain S-box-containing protein
VTEQVRRGPGEDLVQLMLLGEAVKTLDGAAVFVWDEDRHYVAVNDEACRITGLEREELLRMEVGALTQDGASPHFEQAQRAGVLTGRSAFTRRDGTRFEFDFVTLHTTIAGLPYMLSVVWPVST